MSGKMETEKKCYNTSFCNVAMFPSIINKQKNDSIKRKLTVFSAKLQCECQVQNDFVEDTVVKYQEMNTS